ncbi:MAG: L-2-hydroxyglutarate oxidase [Dehalococcoidia bacterium]|nr:L-2-hydroxyglutarate oxidase [Dehalococcoidia bacterium]MSQ35063.1 L-2-hydroxyglutarate oxidase [Dehalococcoidia bacterium]
MPDQKYDVAVVGAGLLGLSTAMSLLKRYPKLKVGVIEKGSEPATGQSGHNSGVIHSGIYYKPGSFKAKFCVEGRAEMVRFCEENDVPYDRCGKVIVALREEELPRLQSLYERGTANKVPGLEIVSAERVKEIEPHVAAIKALWAPNTGIVNFVKVAGVYQQKVQSAGGTIHFNSKLNKVVRNGQETTLETSGGAFGARHVINCGGLHSDTVARMMGVKTDVRIIPFRGEYFSLKKDAERLVKGLIYPVPDPQFPFLGVHFTRTMKGFTEAGPNAVMATAREGYRKQDVNVADFWGTLAWPGFWRMARQHWKTGVMEMNRSYRKSVFVRDLQRLIPEVTNDDLTPGGSGVRAQAVDRKGKLLDDFKIEETPNAVHVLNAPSPGATSSLVIGRYIVDLAARNFSLG